MKALVIVPTVREFKEWHTYSANFKKYKYELLIIGEEKNVNDKFMPEGEFFGVKERAKWFKDNNLEKFADLIPAKSHAETSFGLLIALERKPDMIVFIDDDTLPLDQDYLGTHWKMLESKPKILESDTKWLNSIDPYQSKFFPRGFPYSARKPAFVKDVSHGITRIIANQGLWQNIPDLNAIDYLHWNDRNICKTHDFTTAIGNWATVCSMNLAFLPEIIPAFYQLPMPAMDVARFDDIWSGLFLKKCADVLGNGISTGNPLCSHNKFPRNIFDDIKAEMIGLEINETLFRELEKIELTNKTYLENYRQIATKLNPEAFRSRDYIKFLKIQMLRWSELMERLI